MSKLGKQVLILLALLVIGVPLLMVKTCSLPFREKRDIPLVKVWDETTQKLLTITLEEYVKGVVAAEMPASFELEALKAQAVAARTYAYRRIQKGEPIPEHPEAHLTTDYRSGQAWLSTDQLKERWGWVDYLRNWQKISQAIEETSGEVMFFNGEPILAVYHSTSGGRTENSEHYWSERVPYLRSVSDPYGSHSPYVYSTASFSHSQLAKLLNVSGINDMRIIERYPSGRVKTVSVNGTWFSGRDIRSLLNLRSTWFSITVENATVEFSVWGYGHGVGMPQYGADGMAKQGYDYQEILQYYYQGIVIEKVY